MKWIDIEIEWSKFSFAITLTMINHICNVPIVLMKMHLLAFTTMTELIIIFRYFFISFALQIEHLKYIAV